MAQVAESVKFRSRLARNRPTSVELGRFWRKSACITRIRVLRKAAGSYPPRRTQTLRPQRRSVTPERPAPGTAAGTAAAAAGTRPWGRRPCGRLARSALQVAPFQGRREVRSGGPFANIPLTTHCAFRAELRSAAKVDQLWPAALGRDRANFDGRPTKYGRNPNVNRMWLVCVEVAPELAQFGPSLLSLYVSEIQAGARSRPMLGTEFGPFRRYSARHSAQVRPSLSQVRQSLPRSRPNLGRAPNDDPPEAHVCADSPCPRKLLDT